MEEGHLHRWEGEGEGRSEGGVQRGEGGGQRREMRGRVAWMGLVQVEVERTSLKQALLPPNLLQADGLNKMCLA